MQNIMLSLMINLLMAGLLVATMIYCRKLNVRVKVLQDSKSDLARIVREFDESTTRATQSIADIHAATSRLSDNIQHKIDKANFLADDLQYMIEKSQKVAEKLDPAAARAMETAVQSVVPPRGAAPKAAPMAENAGMRARAGLAGLAGVADTDASAPAAQARGARVRSRAEQEIMSALSGKNTTGE